ncbi:MAG TPA: type II toxin-antitoxin system HicA family toxin [Candidatus Dormibacteraeota bacterium]|nr:type II toxin-antitoxin system HicA family toxin [Candidatus Dormibacteraeota bacterium]
MSAKLPAVGGAQLVRALERAGFRVARIHGSHPVLQHADGRSTSVPVHGAASRNTGSNPQERGAHGRRSPCVALSSSLSSRVTGAHAGHDVGIEVSPSGAGHALSEVRFARKIPCPASSRARRMRPAASRAARVEPLEALLRVLVRTPAPHEGVDQSRGLDPTGTRRQTTALFHR